MEESIDILEIGIKDCVASIKKKRKKAKKCKGGVCIT